jgi:hypothetical protein
VNRLGSSSLRAQLSGALLAVFFALAPTTVPEWRLAPTRPPAAVLPVGEPTPSLAVRPRADRTDGVHH